MKSVVKKGVHMARQNKQNAENKENQQLVIEVTRAKEVDKNTFFDMKVNGVMIYGCRFCTSKEGKDFVSFPSHKGKDDKWYSYAYVELSEENVSDIDKQLDKLL